jgi:23S rRNA (guanosine2251-2'-O)-methyltransferase
VSKASVSFGIHAVLALLEHQPENIKEIYCIQGTLNSRLKSLVQLAQQQGISVQFFQSKKLTDLAEGGRHQGVAAVTLQGVTAVKQYDLFTILDGLEKPALLLILDSIQDPHNLGACMRTANAAGVDAVIVPKDKAVGITPVVSKVASGALETTPFVQVTNLARTMDQLKERGIWLIGTSDAATQSLYQTDLKDSIAIVMGNEGKGMRRLTQEKCDILANLPMQGSVESLNVSVATGVCLYEVLRQRVGALVV